MFKFKKEFFHIIIKVWLLSFHPLRWFVVLTLFISSSMALAMISEEEREHHRVMIRKKGEEVELYQRELLGLTGKSEKDKNVEYLFKAYMEKAAHHFHLGEREEQLSCYKGILKIEGLSKENMARTHTNIAVVYLHLNKTLLAAGHLKKAETIIPMSDVAKIAGAQVYSVFATTYYKTYEELYPTLPEQALKYIQAALQVPQQDENWYGGVHVELAVCYDRLLNFKESLHHALQALECRSLPLLIRDRALCFAAIGSKQANKFDDCLSYFRQIKSLKDLIYTERFLVLSAVAQIYVERGNLDRALEYSHQGLDSLVPDSPQYLLSKHDIAMGYGKKGDKEKEARLYEEILDSIETHTFETSWQNSIRSIKKSIETVFFIREMNKIEKRQQEELQQRSEEEKKLKERERLEKKKKRAEKKEKFRQLRIQEIKRAQQESAEREQRLEEERRQRQERERRLQEERRKFLLDQGHTDLVPPNQPGPSRYVTEEPRKKVKPRGVSSFLDVPKAEHEDPSSSHQPTLPSLGTRAQTIFDMIEEEEWHFTREDYTHYLEDLRCTRRDSGSSHRVFQLPKSMTIMLKREDEEITEEIYLADEDVKLGSVTLPAWKEKFVPYYLRKQLREFHQRIIKLYTKVTKEKL